MAQGGDAQQVLSRARSTPPVVHGLADGAGVEGHDRDAQVETFQHRGAEAFVLAQVQVEVRQLGVGDHLGQRHVAAEMDVAHPQLADQLLQGREIALETAVFADEEQAANRG